MSSACAFARSLKSTRYREPSSPLKMEHIITLLEIASVDRIRNALGAIKSLFDLGVKLADLQAQEASPAHVAYMSQLLVGLLSDIVAQTTVSTKC